MFALSKLLSKTPTVLLTLLFQLLVSYQVLAAVLPVVTAIGHYEESGERYTGVILEPVPIDFENQSDEVRWLYDSYLNGVKKFRGAEKVSEAFQKITRPFVKKQLKDEYGDLYSEEFYDKVVQSITYKEKNGASFLIFKGDEIDELVGHLRIFWPDIKGLLPINRVFKTVFPFLHLGKRVTTVMETLFKKGFGFWNALFAIEENDTTKLTLIPEIREVSNLVADTEKEGSISIGGLLFSLAEMSKATGYRVNPDNPNEAFFPGKYVAIASNKTLIKRLYSKLKMYPNILSPFLQSFLASNTLFYVGEGNAANSAVADVFAKGDYQKLSKLENWNWEIVDYAQIRTEEQFIRNFFSKRLQKKLGFDEKSEDSWFFDDKINPIPETLPNFDFHPSYGSLVCFEQEMHVMGAYLTKKTDGIYFGRERSLCSENIYFGKLNRIRVKNQGNQYYYGFVIEDGTVQSACIEFDAAFMYSALKFRVQEDGSAIAKVRMFTSKNHSEFLNCYIHPEMVQDLIDLYDN